VGHYLLARVRIVEQSDAKEVESLLRQSIRVDPTFWPAHYELGQWLESNGKPEEAVRELAATVDLNSQYAPAHFILARLYTRLGDRPRAVAHRKAHHDLLKQQRDAAERARSEAPVLLYRMEPASDDPKGR
jgi:predicted Zn-dependent protease